MAVNLRIYLVDAMKLQLLYLYHNQNLGKPSTVVVFAHENDF